MKTRKTDKESSAEPPPLVAAAGNRLKRIRRNQRVLIQTMKQAIAAQRNSIPPPRDPLAP